jgi:hypothetical protein
MEAQKTVNNQSNTEQKDLCWSYHSTHLQTILQSYSNKSSMVLTNMKASGTDHKTDINTFSYSHLIFDKGQLLQKTLLGNQKLEWRKLKVNSRLSPCTNQCGLIHNLNIRPETLKLMQERVGNTLKHIGIGNKVLSRTQRAQKLRQRITDRTSWH